jgi:hypothetical protein
MPDLAVPSQGQSGTEMSISKHSYGLGNRSFINTAVLNLNPQSGADFADYSALPPET